MASRGRSARQKGHNFERDVAKLFSEWMGINSRRVLLSGIRGEGDIELNAPFDCHVECKRQEKLSLLSTYLKEQPKAKNRPFLLIHKSNRSPVFVTMDWQSFKEWSELFARMEGSHE
jgi:hypothetical protein